MPKPGKKFEQKQVDQHLAELNKSAAQNLLDDAFGKWNEIRDEDRTLPVLDRADHIVINGRTGTELLMDAFNNEFKTMTKSENQQPFEEYERQRAYNEFYKSKGKDSFPSFPAYWRPRKTGIS